MGVLDLRGLKRTLAIGVGVVGVGVLLLFPRGLVGRSAHSLHRFIKDRWDP